MYSLAVTLGVNKELSEMQLSGKIQHNQDSESSTVLKELKMT